jgi:molecular chaperone GrpE
MAEKQKDNAAADDKQSRAEEPAALDETFDGAVATEHVDEMEQLRRQAAEAQDRFLRSQAEIDNTRKRMRREMDEERRYAELRLLEDLLPVIDNINRAIEAAEKNADAASLLSGIKMVSQQLHDVLDRHHLKPIKASGEPFDPAVHQAILQQPSDEHPENTVVHVGLPGYTLHERVVRPAQVVVSKKSS